MSEHSPYIAAYLGRAVGICNCGFHTEELWGDRRTANVKQALMLHLESSLSDTQEEYQIRDGSPLECPLCQSALELTKADKGILSESQPSIVECEKFHHEWDTYYKNKTLFLFKNESSDGPFFTWF